MDQLFLCEGLCFIYSVLQLQTTFALPETTITDGGQTIAGTSCDVTAEECWEEH